MLFIGEAPGESEDALGFPFVGAAGREFDELVDAAAEQCGKYRARPEPPIEDLFKAVPGGVFTIGITNILACIPRTSEEMATGEIRPPHKEEAAACQPRLLEIIKMANPKAIVCLGRVAARFLPKNLPTSERVRIQILDHPSAILRNEIPSHQALMRKKFIIALSKVLQEISNV